MQIYYQAFGFGIVTAALLAVGAVGFTLQFAVSNVFNLAYGSVMVVAMYAAYVSLNHGAGLWGALAVGGITGSVLSYLINRLVYRHFVRKQANRFTIVLVTLAVALMMANLLEGIVGDNFFSYQLPTQIAYAFGPFRFTNYETIIVGVAVVAMVAVQALLRGTKLGSAMRATAENSDLAGNCGVPTDRMEDIAWLISGFLCGLAGVSLALTIGQFTPTTGNVFLVTIIAAAVVGGVGRPVGAILGALIVGVSEEIVAVPASEYQVVVGFALLILVLLLRPQGILGTAQVRSG